MIFFNPLLPFHLPSPPRHQTNHEPTLLLESSAHVSPFDAVVITALHKEHGSNMYRWLQFQFEIIRALIGFTTSAS
ncbi:hypothetical protein M8C21_021775 [Ambrosia artemisiifolia]|uniref:Uncharacterized protein n=1 Tax=Ambrosia artemisiifolia TaxID=4212 RepID=A0AAD5BMZ7_AMBAR|nr:hypothetical protein M8C21_021775 [Ambrosia artemisiifolia]